MICHGCQKDVHPEVEFDVSGPVNVCPNPECGAHLGKLNAQADATKPEPQPKSAKPKAEPASDEPLDVLKLAKQRHRYVSKEAKRLSKELKKFQAEEIKLKRLLKAAETPVAEVRQLRRAGS